jgi:hypothetical protein
MNRFTWSVATIFIVAGPAYCKEPVDESLLTLAQAMASPICDSFDAAKNSQTDPNVLLRNEIAYQRLVFIPQGLGAVNDARGKCVAGLTSCNRSMEKLHQLDRYSPDFKSLAEKSINAGPAIYRAANDEKLSSKDKDALGDLAVKTGVEVVGAAINAYDRWSEKKSYTETYMKMRSESQRAIAKLCVEAYKDKKHVSDVFAVGVTGSWNNTFSNDMITIRNKTGKKLTNCIIITQLTGFNAKTGDKEYDCHIHYVAAWADDLRLYASYPSRCHNGIASNQSVDAIDKVEVVVLSDQLISLIEYQYIGKNYDDDVKQFVNEVVKLQFTGSWYYYSKKNVLYNSGQTFSFKSTLSSIPVSLITITAIQGKQEASISRTMAGGRLPSGVKQWMSDAKFNDFDNPDTVKILIEFPRSSYKHELVWDYRK